ncbi:MAG: ATP-dependent RNA helicase DeaD [Pseudohongiella sp.]|nr:MAG: ATP-dependent RNA helicase DeaD [Pseudohongiella sp.]
MTDKTSSDAATAPELPSFKDLALSTPVMKALNEVGYETPSPIQSQTIPLLLEGRDVLGQAQTGTGKTAAFALPILSKLDLKQKEPQVLVLAPTRELAIQVAEAFQRYACHMKGFHVIPIYGGQDYSGQIRALKRGVHVVVGTPGRVMDHMRKGTLKLDKLKVLVLDEADEMLRMGFIDDVEWILESVPGQRQIALFSATLPKQVRHIATRHLHDQVEITIKQKTSTADTIRQRFWQVSGLHKLDALTRILEAEEFDGMIVFVRTKIATVDLAEKLSARGFAASPLNGDIAQKQREMTVEKLKRGKLDILVATDVAARGLDVDRVSHVINYDIPYDTEAYIHRIGRTGRAGRKGDAILFVAPREKRLLHAIERATKNPIEQMDLPSAEDINEKRIAQFKLSVTETLDNGKLDFFQAVVQDIVASGEHSIEEVAAALAKLAQGKTPLLLQSKPTSTREHSRETSREGRRGKQFGDGLEARPHRRKERPARETGEQRRQRGRNTEPDEGLERFRIEVGHDHEVKPGNIMGAIANEAGLDAKDIGRINIYDSFSTVDLPLGMPDDIFSDLKKTWVAGRNLRISRFKGELDAVLEAGSGGRPQQDQRQEFADKPHKRKKMQAKDAVKKPKKSKLKAKAKAEKPVRKEKKRARDEAANRDKGKRRAKSGSHT